MNYKNSLRAFLLLLCLSFLIPACQLAGSNQSDAGKLDIVKSENDSRQYQYLELPNRLRVLLVSDPNADKAAASLDVYIGSRQDPDNANGLAHFLEHMLFLGTEKYPEAGAYQAYISENNGSHNAYTAFEHTNYFFDISPEKLDPTLDRFAQFFIAPLFTEQYVDRERNAVHSEYMSKIQDEYRKSLDVLRNVANPKHPFTKFSVGSLDTLQDRPEQSLRQQLISFYDRYYSANLMTLVVVGREPLQELQAMVVPKFSQVPDRGTVIDNIDEPLFAAGQLPLQINIRPDKKLRSLTIMFPTPAIDDYYRQKPLQYLGNILGHEGKGSLLSYLKSEGYAEGLSAGAGLTYRGGASFSINIQLTEKGAAHADEISQAVFQTINRIRESADQGWLYDEQQAIADVSFRFQEKSSPVSYASGLSRSMHYYPPRDLLKANYIMDAYDKPLIDKFLGYLNAGNAVLTLNAPEVEVDSKTALYNADYKVQAVPGSTLQQWKNAGLSDIIQLPEPNDYIAENFSLIDTRQAAKLPQLLVERDDFHFWFQNDNSFDYPKGDFYFSLRSPLSSQSAEPAARVALLARLFSDQLNEDAYPAYLAGLDFSLRPHMRGITVKINGYNDKQQILLDKIISVIQAAKLDPQRFKDIKAEVIRQLGNADMQQPYQRLMAELPKLLYRQQWSDGEMLAAYEGISFESLQAFAPEFLSSLAIDALAHGNYSQADVEHFSDSLEKAFLSPLASASLPAIDVMKLPTGDHSLSLASSYSDASIMLYLQASNDKLETRAAFGVLAQLLRPGFYTGLRTEKQLGYIVTSGAFPVQKVPGVFFLVQSPVMGAEGLRDEIGNFLADKIPEVTEQQFLVHRDALVERLSERPKNLAELSGRYWQDIIQAYYQFDFRQQLIIALRQLEYSQWKQLVNSEVGSLESRALWLYTVGKFSPATGLEQKTIAPVGDFKQRQDYYQFGD